MSTSGQSGQVSSAVPAGTTAPWVKTTSGSSTTGSTPYSANAETQYAYPNDVITWKHQILVVNGPTTLGVSCSSGKSVSWSGTTNCSPSPALATNTAGTATGTPYAVSPVETVTIKQSDVTSDGSIKYCDTLNSSPFSASDATTHNSNQHCVTAPYNYPGCTTTSCPTPGCTATTCPNPGNDCTYLGTCPTPTPTNNGVKPVTTVSISTPNVGDTINFTYTVTNPTGPTKSMTNLAYQTYIFVVKSGNTMSSSTTSGPMAYNGVSTSGVPSLVTTTRTGLSAAVLALGYSTTGPNATSVTAICPGTSSTDCPTTSFAVNSSNITLGSDVWNNVSVGDQICSYVVLNNYWSVVNNAPAKTLDASNIQCATVAKTPQIQLRGSDSWSGATQWGTGTISGSCSTSPVTAPCAISTINGTGGFTGASFSSNAINTVRGSFSQYGLLTDAGTITSFGSADWTTFSGTPNQTNTCKLWFANSTSTTGSTCSTVTTATGGKFNTVGTRSISLPSVPTTAGTGGPALNLATFTTSGVYKYTGNVTLSGAVPDGVQLTIYATGTITVTGNITYGTGTTAATAAAKTYTNLSSIPVLNVYAAGNLSIASGVTTLYGNYITSGLYDCGTGANGNGTPGTADLGQGNTCSQQLTVNGAIVSLASPRFQRTFGAGSLTTDTSLASDTSPMAPSEVLNYTPNSFLTPFYNNTMAGSGATAWQATSQTELPARY